MAPEQELYTCHQCSKKFCSITSLKKHMAISHMVKITQGVVFDAARHAGGNLPQCAFCKHKFGEWRGLKMHIQRMNCHKLMQSQAQPIIPNTGEAFLEVAALPPPAHEDPDTSKMIKERGWKSLLDSAHVEHFKQRCCLWVRDPTALKQAVEPQLEDRCAEVKTVIQRDGTCPWCARTSYSRHFKQRNVIFQCALLRLLQEDAQHVATVF